MAPPPYATTTVAVSQTYSPLQKVEILAAGNHTIGAATRAGNRS